MRIAMMLALLSLVSLATGCGSRPQALFIGALEDGTFWKNPLSAASNEGVGYSKGSRVEVYDEFVVVTTSDGLSHIHPHGFYTGLRIKKD